MPLRLAFEAREGELGGGQDHNASIVLVFIIIITLRNLPVLRLTFEVMEGGEKLLKHPLQLAFEVRKGVERWRGRVVVGERSR